MFKKSHILFISLLICVLTLKSQVTLPRLVSDGMVLQRNTPVNIWGWASPGEEVTVRFLDDIYTTITGEDSIWHITLAEMEAGGPYSMEINATNSISLQDILVGEVWVCSGQSQMDINMNRVRPLYEEEIRQAGNPMVHYFSVPTAYKFGSANDDLKGGKWEAVSQDNILSISAIAYFFSDFINKELDVPVGMIRSSVGGSPAEAWISEEALREFPEHYREAQRFEDDSLIKKIEQENQKVYSSWYGELNEKDAAYHNAEIPWYLPGVDDSDWDTMEIPGYWADEKIGAVNGAVWFRRSFAVPASMVGKEVKLNLGRIVDADSAFINGVYVGGVGYQYPPRRYVVPEGVLKEGENTLVVKVISNAGRGGFVPDKPYHLAAEGDTVELAGTWKYRVGAVMEPMSSTTFIRFKPTGLYNGMIAPLTHYSIRGVLWYQGESNAGRPVEYADLLPALIRNWREDWDQGEFPFLYVQLPNFMESHDEPTESNWALMRESQLKTLSVPNTAMAVAIDLGEWNDIHPLNKKDVAYRLSLLALDRVYGQTDIVSSGPLFESMKIDGNHIDLTFSETGSGLVIAKGETLKEFTIAGKDRKFYRAEASISGNQVIVSSEKVKKPVAVRYAWADNPEHANLYNEEGLPASPFRTDDW